MVINTMMLIDWLESRNDNSLAIYSKGHRLTGDATKKSKKSSIVSFLSDNINSYDIFSYLTLKVYDGTDHYFK